ncbi:HET-domain-containing protein [Xylaria arbuscula]|nr:HET-domain-containing protein [Xylaria arbuscula]
MRLIDVKTLELKEFHHGIRPYAILSHTWGGEEVTYHDYLLATGASACPRTNSRIDVIKRKAGFTKIVGACRRAQADGLAYLWCDTNCIDKSSSAELTEAINSMYAWYRDSRVCYAYLADVHTVIPGLLEEFKSSRWFTRGWTLQELLAPQKLIFFTASWTVIENRDQLSGVICEVTRIHVGALRDRNTIPKFSVAQRMSWAANRQTTRHEDIAYCLLGIFGVSMPLLYGEEERAFLRLQQEIIKESDDNSILAWEPYRGDDRDRAWGGVLAPSPINFTSCGSIIRAQETVLRCPYSFTNLGISMKVPIMKTTARDLVLIGLNCDYSLCGRVDKHNIVWLRLRYVGQDVYDRCLLPGSRIYLEGSYSILHHPTEVNLYLTVNHSSLDHLRLSTASISSLRKSLEQSSSGFLVTLSSGRINPELRVFREVYSLPDFCVTSLRTRGMSTTSHELVSAGGYSTILSVAWGCDGSPSQCVHSTFHDVGMGKISSISSNPA